jgi:hypothetical protein
MLLMTQKSAEKSKNLGQLTGFSREIHFHRGLHGLHGWESSFFLSVQSV